MRYTLACHHFKGMFRDAAGTSLSLKLPAGSTHHRVFPQRLLRCFPVDDYSRLNRCGEISAKLLSELVLLQGLLVGNPVVSSAAVQLHNKMSPGNFLLSFARHCRHVFFDENS